MDAFNRWVINENFNHVICEQLVHEVVIDRDFVNNRFADHGGARWLDKILRDQLDTVLDGLNETIWSERRA